MAIYYTFFRSLLYICEMNTNRINSVARLAVYSKQAGLYSKMYIIIGALYISKSIPKRTFWHKCIVCTVNSSKVHRVYNNNRTFQKGCFTYIETLRAFTIHSIHQAPQGEKR